MTPWVEPRKIFDTITRFELGGFTESFDDLDHRLAIQDAGDLVSDS